MWKPISLPDLRDLIFKSELKLNDEQMNFWDLIKIEPEKWAEKAYGSETGGFWVIAIFGREVIWYNDIEEEFNISDYQKYGEIKTYGCSLDGLNYTVIALMDRIKANRS